MSAADRYEPPGKMIAVEGRLVHALEGGTGSPTIVFESGMGGNLLDWTRVIAALPPRLHHFAYDRAGLGWSAPGPDPRSPARIVTELEAALAAARIDPPYVLVAHSMGCRYARLLALRHPAEVAGLVLVDGYHEAWDAAVGPQAVESFISARIRFWRTAAVLGRLGIVRLLGRRLVPLLGPDFRQLPETERARYIEVLTAPRALDVAADELRHGGDSSDDLRDANLGDVPVVVIAHGLPFRDTTQERAWQDSQVEMAARSSRGRLIRAAGSSHSVMIAEPNVVVEAIVGLVGPEA